MASRSPLAIAAKQVLELRAVPLEHALDRVELGRELRHEVARRLAADGGQRQRDRAARLDEDRPARAHQRLEQDARRPGLALVRDAVDERRERRLRGAELGEPEGYGDVASRELDAVVGGAALGGDAPSERRREREHGHPERREDTAGDGRTGARRWGAHDDGEATSTPAARAIHVAMSSTSMRSPRARLRRARRLDAHAVTIRPPPARRWASMRSSAMTRATPGIVDGSSPPAPEQTASSRRGKLLRRAPVGARKHLTGRVVDAEAAAELTGVVPADGLVAGAANRRQRASRLGRDVDEEVDPAATRRRRPRG